MVPATVMDLAQLRTFVTVAREGSITRASELLHLSQPAVSAHIKAMEDTLGLGLFTRTPRGMTLTSDGQRLIARAEQTLAAHQALLDEAARRHGELVGTLRLGTGGTSSHAALGRFMTALCERLPGVQVVLRHASSQDVLAGVRNHTLDAGFYNEPGAPAADLAALEVGAFAIHVAAAKGLFPPGAPTDWAALARMPWIFPTGSACCSRTAERLFAQHRFNPARVISVDRQDIISTLVASGLGVGLLHADAAADARQRGDVDLLGEAEEQVRVMFVHLASRAREPLLEAAMAIMRESR